MKTSKGHSLAGAGSRNEGKMYGSAGGSEAGKKHPDISMQMRSEGGANTSYLPPINTGGIVANNSVEGSGSRNAMHRDVAFDDPYENKTKAVNLIDSLTSSERHRSLNKNAKIQTATGRNGVIPLKVSSEFNSGEVQDVSINQITIGRNNGNVDTRQQTMTPLSKGNRASQETRAEINVSKTKMQDSTEGFMENENSLGNKQDD